MKDTLLVDFFDRLEAGWHIVAVQCSYQRCLLSRVKVIKNARGGDVRKLGNKREIEIQTYHNLQLGHAFRESIENV